MNRFYPTNIEYSFSFGIVREIILRFDEKQRRIVYEAGSKTTAGKTVATAKVAADFLHKGMPTSHVKTGFGTGFIIKSALYLQK